MVFCRNCEFWKFKEKGIKLGIGKCTNKTVKGYLGKDTTTFSTNYCWWGIEKL